MHIASIGIVARKDFSAFAIWHKSRSTSSTDTGRLMVRTGGVGARSSRQQSNALPIATTAFVTRIAFRIPSQTPWPTNEFPQ
jgi:hypothetical protein